MEWVYNHGVILCININFPTYISEDNTPPRDAPPICFFFRKENILIFISMLISI